VREQRSSSPVGNRILDTRKMSESVIFETTWKHRFTAAFYEHIPSPD